MQAAFQVGQWIYNTRLLMAAQYVGPVEGDDTCIRLMYTAWQPHGMETAWAGQEFQGAATTFIPLDDVKGYIGEVLRDWDDALAEDAERAQAVEPAVVGADRNIVIEPEVQADAVTEKQIALIEAELAELTDAAYHRRAVVKSINVSGIVRVSIQKWQRIAPRADESSIGDTYRWVELRSVRF